MVGTKLAVAANNTLTTTYQTATFTPTPNRLVLAFVMSGGGPSIAGSTTVVPTPTSTNGVKWVQVGTLKHPAAELRLTCFRAMVQNPVAAGALSLTFGSLQRWCAWGVYEYDGLDSNGSDGEFAIGDVTPAVPVFANALETGLASPDKLAVGAIALGSQVSNLNPGAGATTLDTQQTTAFVGGGNGTLSTQERTGSAGSPSVRWSWTQTVNAVAIAVLLKPKPPPITPPVSPYENLVRRFEPILFLHPQESFMPSDAKRYVEHCALWKARIPFNVKRSWGEAGAPFPRAPMVMRNGLSARAGELGSFIGDPLNIFDDDEERFLELAGWKDASEGDQQTVTAGSSHPYANRGEIFKRYATEPALTDSRFWYHAEVFDNDRLRRLLRTVQVPALLPILDDAKFTKPILLCYYLFFPAHEQHSMEGTCGNDIKAREVGSCGGDWACIALLLDRIDETVPYTPRFIGLTGDQTPVDPPHRPHSFDDANRINLNVEPWLPPQQPSVIGDHPRIHVALGSHSLAMRSGILLGDPFPSNARPAGCGRFDSPTLIPTPPDKPTVWEDLAVIIAKVWAGGLIGGAAALAGAVAGLAETVEAFPEITFDPPLEGANYPAPSTATTIKPKDIDVADAGPAVENWKSQNGVKIGTTTNERLYNFIVDRTQEKWWPSDPTDRTQTGYRGRWGPRVEDDPLSRRAGMRFPDFWKMFFLAIEDGKGLSK